MAEQCCCGRIKEWTAPVFISNRLHERFGDEGAFCGSTRAHTIRDQGRELERLRAEIVELQTVIGHLFKTWKRIRDEGLEVE